MEQNLLRSEDYVKVLQFIESIQIAKDDFAMQVLTSLSSIFGYTKANFWLDDGKGNLYYPITTMKDNFLQEYMDDNYKLDQLHPKNLGIDYVVSKKVMHMNYVLSPTCFEKTPYYQFLQRHGLKSEFGTYLTNVDTLIGAIAIVQSKGENDVSAYDMNVLKVLSKYISQGLHTNQMYMRKNYEKMIFEAFANNSSTGLIFCDLSLKVHYCNNSSREICKELLANERYYDPIEYLMQNVLANHRDLWKLGYENTFYTSSLKKIRVNILPTTIGNYGISGQNLFFIMLSYEDNEVKNSSLQQKPDTKLTVRERQILNLIVQGKTNQEIAEELYISIDTVKKYLSVLFEKFNVKNRTSLMYKILNN